MDVVPGRGSSGDGGRVELGAADADAGPRRVRGARGWWERTLALEAADADAFPRVGEAALMAPCFGAGAGGSAPASAHADARPRSGRSERRASRRDVRSCPATASPAPTTR